MFLEKFIDVYIILEKNFNNDIKAYFDGSYNTDSDEEYSDEENADGKFRMKKIKCKYPFLEKIKNI